jgi:hypothetical protein
VESERTGSVEVEVNGGSHHYMKSDAVYNKPENLVYVRTDGDTIYVVCDKEEQMDVVVRKLTTPQCKLAGYEEWDKDADKKWILTFHCTDRSHEIQPELN